MERQPTHLQDSLRRSSSPWLLFGAVATLSAPLQGQVLLQHPHQGFEVQGCGVDAITDMQILSLVHPDAAFGTSRAEPLVESYARGADLVTRYAQSPLRTSRPECYWRFLSDTASDVMGIELIVSVQTSLLTSTPAVKIRSRMTTDELLAIDSQHSTAFVPLTIGDMGSAPRILVGRPRGLSNWTYAEMIYPSDFIGGRVTEAKAATEFVWDLFPESLEKGVIRRARVRGYFVRRENDYQLIRDAYDQFVRSELPLTT